MQLGKKVRNEHRDGWAVPLKVAEYDVSAAVSGTEPLTQNDGMIFVSIDDGELENLRAVYFQNSSERNNFSGRVLVLYGREKSGWRR